MDGQMDIFDYIPKEPKRVGANCTGCKYKVWLHKGGSGVQSCDYYDGCRYTPKQTCGNCRYYEDTVSGPGDIYEQKMCLRERPFAKSTTSDDSCDYWRKDNEKQRTDRIPANV